MRRVDDEDVFLEGDGTFAPYLKSTSVRYTIFLFIELCFAQKLYLQIQMILLNQLEWLKTLYKKKMYIIKMR